MALIGYGRVSTDDQHPESQIDALTAAGCDPAHLFIDRGVSGKVAKRPKLDAALLYLRRGDLLVVTRLDRLGRSVKNLIELSADLDERGVGLKVIEQGIDTSTAAGRMFFHVLAALAEFEATLIRERTIDGLAAARAHGRKGGRPRKLSERQVATIRQLHDGGSTVTELADTFKVSRPTIYAVLEAEPTTVS